jgi:hypothetical protein
MPRQIQSSCLCIDAGRNPGQMSSGTSATRWDTMLQPTAREHTSVTGLGLSALPRNCAENQGQNKPYDYDSVASNSRKALSSLSDSTIQRLPPFLCASTIQRQPSQVTALQ